MAITATKTAMRFITGCLSLMGRVYANDMGFERKRLFFSTAFWSGLIAAQASAHASEQGLVLLLPTDVYAAAGTLTVVASIVFATCLPRRAVAKMFKGMVLVGRPRMSLEAAAWAVSVGSTLFLLFLIFVGFRGPTDPQNNLLPLTIWTVFWGGVFVVQGVVFDVWRWINPWSGIAHLFGLGQRPLLSMPSRIASWPAVVMLVCFQLFLLADVAPSDPQRLAFIVLGYWAITMVGIELFGADIWLRRVECFSVMFRMIGMLRPVRRGGTLGLGLPGWGALNGPPLDLSLAVFCLVILAGGSFDGVNETFWWLAKLGINPLEFPGRSAVIWPSTLGLFAAIFLLCFAFGLSIWLGLTAVRLSGSAVETTFLDTLKLFAITLLPIALGYHFAHYLIGFMVQIKVTLSAASDPLALGWNLAGLGAVKATVGFLSVPETVKTIWLVQAGVVVVSHVVAVLMSHYVACKICSNNRDVFFVQVGLTVLMIAYTVFGLWLLASPRGA